MDRHDSQEAGIPSNGILHIFIVMSSCPSTDLVPVGSYRTNISMSDLEHNTGKENPAVTDLQETDISRFEGMNFIT